MNGNELDGVAQAFADIVDATSPYTYLSHGTAFAELAPMAAAHHEKVDGTSIASGAAPSTPWRHTPARSPTSPPSCSASDGA